jgi:Tol biopolymer transport system component
LAWNETDWWLVPLDGARSRPTGAFRELRRQGFSLGFDRIPQASQWTKDFITFSAVFGDAVNVFRAPISREGHIIGRAVRLTSGTTTEISPTLTANGEVIFASLNRNLAVWSLSSDSDHGKVAGELKRITQSAAAIMPSISADGRVLTFTAVRRRTGVSSDLAIPDEKRRADVPAWFPENAAELQIVLKILVTGKETVLSTADIAEWHPQISRDGSMVAYTSGKEGRIYAARVNGGPIKMIVSGGLVWDWSLDNKRLLFNVHKNAEVHAVDLSTGNEKLFLSRPGYSIFQTRFSPDDRAIALVGCWQQHDRSPPQCQIYVVPIENGVPLPWQGWIAIDHAGHWDDKPRWSPNGELIYFISDRDGYLCLWAQRVEKATKRLVGFPFPVYHFHNSRLAMANMGTCPLEFDVAKDKMVFGLGELSGNIWALRQK